MSFRPKVTAVAVLFACVLGLGAQIVRADAAADELTKLKGKWIGVSADLGEGMKEDLLKERPFALIFDGNKLRVIEGSSATRPSTRPADEHGDTGLVSVDPAAKPATMDWNQGVNARDTMPLIYRLEGDTLTICFGKGATARPTEFKAAKGTVVMVLKREK